MEQSSGLKISFVIPVFNEQDSVSELHAEIVNTMKGLDFEYEIIFIDDGSIDKTLENLKFLSPVKIISFMKNYGKSQALQVGFNEANGDYIITMDGDLQDDPQEIPNFIQKISNVDLVCGWKQRRLDPVHKRIVSKIANSVTRIFTGVKIHDMNCCFKIYKKEVVKNLKLYGDMHRYIPSIVAHMGFSVDEMSVHHRQRKYGKTKYGIGRLLSGLFDFSTLIFIRKFTDRPMHFFGTLGMLLLTIGFIILAYITWLKLSADILIGNRPLFFLGILLILVGFQSFTLGFIGELIIRTHGNDKKNYTIKEEIINE